MIMPDTEPAPAGADCHFRQQLEQGKFVIQRCSACRRSIFYPRMLCPHCGCAQLEWFSPSGLGTVYSSTVIRRKSEDGGDYNVALVDLEEGPRIMSRVETVPPEQVAIGMRVEVRVIDDENGKLLVFTPHRGRP